MHPHNRPSKPWAKVAADLFSLEQRNFLITVDYWSNFYELDQLGSTDATAVVKCLKRHFARHGIPDEVISDNGPQFTAEVFKEFDDKWMFQHITSSPYFPQSNGLVENSVKTAKNLLRTAVHSGEDAWLSILTHRNTPTTGMTTSPAQRLFSRRTRTLLPTWPELLKPEVVPIEEIVGERDRLQKDKKYYYNRSAAELDSLPEESEVWVSPATLPQKESQKGKIVELREEPRS